jgi:hypothetical protein
MPPPPPLAPSPRRCLVGAAAALLLPLLLARAASAYAAAAEADDGGKPPDAPGEVWSAFFAFNNSEVLRGCCGPAVEWHADAEEVNRARSEDADLRCQCKSKAQALPRAALPLCSPDLSATTAIAY